MFPVQAEKFLLQIKLITLKMFGPAAAGELSATRANADALRVVLRPEDLHQRVRGARPVRHILLLQLLQHGQRSLHPGLHTRDEGQDLLRDTEQAAEQERSCQNSTTL
ncbi:unnamed protein product [Trichogramma brassicae]|uniref:Uncharacterized protein n=1 Tax=Trichogramma brassicae TaxID=86971 RepID=A0A6H5IVP9_9HYME|nr:unnamed protein product [Trichogramma brassicae]